MLIRSGCLFQALRGEVSPCSHGGVHQAGPGAFVLVQRCDTALRPLGSPVVAGPLHEADDTAALCEWLKKGIDAGEPLPFHLRPVALGHDG
ncbi:hypothetical protein [Amycolatopsis ultiminotia]|uniref:hypothetical protein n=1 Tax=Amycolatopsis ultiminotia TaxID=543629 RepID=UPI0031EF0417